MSLELRDIEARFGAVVALQGVSMTLERGRVFAVVGPNGSGKSTLFNCVSGLVRPTRGRVSLDGRSLDGMAPHRRVTGGIARTFQTPRFDPEVTVETAVLCGFYPVARVGLASTLFRLPNAGRQERALRERCRKILRDLRLGDVAELPVGELPMGHVRLVEVARAIANDPKYLLLDEPAAGLTESEHAVLGSEIQRLAASGVGILLVEHNFALVRRLSDEVLVLDRGRELLRGPVAAVERDPRFIDAYLGSSGRDR